MSKLKAKHIQQRICTIHRQHGITLILVLIFIVSLSLIAAVGMRNVGTGERVVANERDRALSFQGAESAGREAVAKITDGSVTAMTTGLYTAPLPRGGNAEFWRTTSSLAVDACASTDATKRFDWTNCAAQASNTYGNSVAPLYVVETLPPVVISPTITEQWYRVTSRASGGSNQADVILQLMFKNP
jgi:type IV pilus assembly protein PilX